MTYTRFLTSAYYLVLGVAMVGLTATTLVQGASSLWSNRETARLEKEYAQLQQARRTAQAQMAVNQSLAVAANQADAAGFVPMSRPLSLTAGASVALR